MKYAPIFLEIDKERDRGAALIAVGFLDRQLSDAIKANLRQDARTAHRLFKPTGALGGFANRVLLGYLMGLFKAETMTDLGRIGDVRNQFAHNADPIDFDFPEIAKDVDKIKIFERFWSVIPDPHGPGRPTRRRHAYLESVSLAANWLHHQATHPGMFVNRDDVPF